MISLNTNEQLIHIKIKQIRENRLFYHDFHLWEQIFELLYKDKDKLKNLIALEYSVYLQRFRYKITILNDIEVNITEKTDFYWIFVETIEKLFHDPA